MSGIDKFVTQKYPILCKGRDKKGELVLDSPVEVEVTISKSPGNSLISCSVECPYNFGPHGDYCAASNPKRDKEREANFCPYSLDIPHAMDNYSKFLKKN